VAYSPKAAGAATATESSQSAVSWAAIIAGAFAAATLTFVLFLVGSGLGLTIISPWTRESASLTTFAVSTAIWLIVTQWLSSGLGGYLAGRLRTRWTGIHTDETFFRDTVHGLLTWSLATMLMVFVLGSAVSSTVGNGVQALSTVASGAATGATAAAAGSDSTSLTSYMVTSLLRPADPTKLPSGAEGDAAATAQASSILMHAALVGSVTPDEKGYLSKMVAARTGLSVEDADARLNSVLAEIDKAKATAKEAADKARKASATFAILAALSMFIGAFIACVAAALGGRQRDEAEDAFLTR